VPPQPTITVPADRRTIAGPVGGPLAFLARGAQTGGSLTALENVIPPGQGPPLHLHDGEDESWYVLEGELAFVLGEERHRAPAGSFVFVPRGTPHCFVNVGTAPARVLVLFTPAGMEGFFTELAALERPDPTAFARLGEPVGMRVLGPPLQATPG
jgi:quercetin dioxygenase-like cupin family protein